MLTDNTLKDIRDYFAGLLRNVEYVTLPGNVRTIEIAAVTFKADEPLILGAVNDAYVQREIEWYLSQSLSVEHIPGGPPKIWKEVASKEGLINSNYGWCIFSEENGSQYEKVLAELKRDPSSRRGIMIYTRPTMHVDAFADGKRDFMCTNTVQYLIRRGELVAHVSMRSNDAVWGYKNDKFWQDYVHQKLANDLGIPVGDMYWTAGSLHFYERHFFLVHHYSMTGELHITKEEYRKKYPDSEWR